MSSSTSPSEILLRGLSDFILSPREDLDCELKGWLDFKDELHKADLAQAILALANYGGKYIIIGFSQKSGQWAPSIPHPSDLKGYSQDIVNGIVERYCEPPFQCNVYHVLHPLNNEFFPVIVVPGNHRVPIRAKRDGPNKQHVQKDVYYIRRPGPQSAPIQTAREWDTLINRCIRNAKEDLLEDLRSLLSSSEPPSQLVNQEFEDWIQESRRRFESLIQQNLPNETPSRYAGGVWVAAYSIMDDFKPLDLTEFLKILQEVEGGETGWPVWMAQRGDPLGPHPYEGHIECWINSSREIFQDAAHSDFWRANPKGKMFLLRGYIEDNYKDTEPGTVFDPIIPIWRIGECLLHAERLAHKLEVPNTIIRFHVQWEGLSGRSLNAISRPSMWSPFGRISHQNTVKSSLDIPVEKINSNLPELIQNLTRPLYEVFDFASVPFQTIQNELSDMRRGRIRI